MRYSGQVTPRLPSSAPLELRLPQEVYALDGLGSDYMVAPGARLSVGPHGRLYESMGAFSFPGGKTGMIVAGVAALGLVYLLTKKRGR